jgi:hypothetical protein
VHFLGLATVLFSGSVGVLRSGSGRASCPGVGCLRAAVDDGKQGGSLVCGGCGVVCFGRFSPPCVVLRAPYSTRTHGGLLTYACMPVFLVGAFVHLADFKVHADGVCYGT